MLALSSAVSSNNSIDSIAASVDLTGTVNPGIALESATQNDNNGAFADFLALADSPASALTTPSQGVPAQPAPLLGNMALVNPAVLVSSLAIGSVMDRAPDASVTAELLASDSTLIEAPELCLTEPDVTDSDEDGEDTFPAKHLNPPTETAGLTISAYQTHYSLPSSLANSSATAIHNEPETAKDANEATGPRIDDAETKTAASLPIGLENGVSNNKLPAPFTYTPQREVKSEAKNQTNYSLPSSLANSSATVINNEPETAKDANEATGPRIDDAETKTAASLPIGLENRVSNSKLPAPLTNTPQREVKSEAKLGLVANANVANVSGVRREAQLETDETKSTGTSPAQSASISPSFENESKKTEQTSISPDFKSAGRATDSLTEPAFAASSGVNGKTGIVDNALPHQQSTTTALASARGFKAENFLDKNGSPADLAESKVTNPATVGPVDDLAVSAPIHPRFNSESNKTEQTSVSPGLKSFARETDSLTKPTLAASSGGNAKTGMADKALPLQQGSPTAPASARGSKAENSLDGNGDQRDLAESKVTNQANVGLIDATKLNNQSSILGDLPKSSKENGASTGQPGVFLTPQSELNPKVEKAERGSSYSELKGSDRELLSTDTTYGPSTLTSTSAKQTLVSASAPNSAQIAVQPEKTEKTNKDAPVVKNKNISQVYDKKSYASSKNSDGTINAKDPSVMSPSYTSITTPVVSVKPSDLPAPVAPAAAMRMVEQVADVADRLSARTNEKVDVRIELEGNRHVDVHVSMQGGRVHADFRSDSPEVRAALSSAWEGFVQSREGAAQRWAEPVFAAPASSNFIPPVSSSSGASDAGLTGSGQNQERREAPGREAASNGNWNHSGSSRSGASNPSSPATPTDSSGRRPETSRHLSVIA